MSHVIYNNTSFKRFRTPNGIQSFATERAAKGVLTKMVNQNVLNRANWTVASYDDWYAADPLVETTNCLTGNTCMIRASELGGCCDPAMERYHTM